MDNNIHFIDFKSINSIFYDENYRYIFDLNRISQEHLSQRERISLKEFLSQKSHSNITNLHKQHLVKIVMGIDENNNEIHPINVYRIITERSKIIVENGINDWKFIQGICQIYSNGKTKRRSIYELLNQAIKDERIESENAGGVGEIAKITQRWIESSRYQNIVKYRLMAIFDSDKESSRSPIPNTIKSKIEFFKSSATLPINYEYETTDLIIWHMLYKRKIENYVPLDPLIQNITSITQDQKNELKIKNPDELDFMEYNRTNIGIGKSKIKEQFPEIFLTGFSYSHFEKRCEHHKVFVAEANERISEIEQILLKMAKIL